MVGVNYKDPRPIYEQVKEILRKQIITGVMASGEKLPSVRELAQAEQVNPNTIQRAYRELENEGYIYSVPGKGSFAAERHDVLDIRKANLLKKFDETVSELVFLGITGAELCDRIGGTPL